MLPFQTPDFNPGDEKLVHRVSAAPRLHVGFCIGSSAHLVDDKPWICLSTDGLVLGTTHVAHPLPMRPGQDVFEAMGRFRAAWSNEAERMGLYAQFQARREESRREVAEARARWETTQPKPKRPKPKPHELEGAVVLPGMEVWLNPKSSGSTRT